jgi:hypothetical protein
MPGSSNGLFPHVSPPNPVHASPLTHTCHIPHPSQSSWF